MKSFEFLAMIAFIDWCAVHPPHWQPPRIPQDADPTKEFQGWMTKPWVAQAITRFHYFILAVLLVTVAITHHPETFNLAYGPFLCVPGYRVFVALLPTYKPYPGVWDKVKEGASRTPIPGAVDKIKDTAGGNPLSGVFGKGQET